ncbi:MAG: DUF6285 domain-containing protein, partial [Tepidiformaceae bacterium]
MQDRPNVDELLEAVAGFLHDDLMPNTTGRLSFHARVAGNVIQMLRRELALEEDTLDREWAGLDGLLGQVPKPARLSDLRAATLGRNNELVRRIQSGEADGGEQRTRTLAHLRASLRDKLAVSNPGLAAEG